MKMLPEHFTALKTVIEAFITNELTDTQRAELKSPTPVPKLPTPERVGTSYRWLLYFKARKNSTVNLTKGLYDSHIDTALREIFKQLGYDMLTKNPITR